MGLNQGIIVGGDITQEWLLPWWWRHYEAHNHLPVAFVDFGLSFEKKNWCQEKGVLVPLPIFDFTEEREKIDPSLIREWEEEFGNSCWESRGAWFKKPFACLNSPFDRSIWIDLDCEVRGPLDDLFSTPRFGLAKDQREDTYNSGVIVFQKRDPIIRIWADESKRQNAHFRGDQELLSQIIREKKLSISELPPLYNWSRRKGENPNARIYHWHGPQGKIVIKHEIELWESSY